VLQEADENQFIRVQETFTDDTGQSTTVASAATSKVADVAPNPATPTVSGNAIEGSTLTASSVTTGSDEALTITYQWQTSANGTSGWTNIASNSTSSTYVLQEADENQFIRVQETFTDDTGQSTTVWSAATSKVVDVAPTPATPTVSGNAIEGSTLTASSVTTGSDEALTIAYQWQTSANGTSGWTNIASNNTSSTYVLQEANENQFIRVQETFTDDTGQSTALASAATSKVVDVAPTPATPTVSGNTIEGSTLTASSVTTGSDEALTITYQWQTSANGTSGWTNIASNSTSSTYVLQEANENQFIRVQETFTDDTGQSTTVWSAATSKVVDVAPTLRVTVSGTAREGQTLTATPTVTSDSDGGTTTYQWQSLSGSIWSNISGATATTYRVAEADEGHQLRVTATFTDDTGQSVSAQSSATTAVTDITPTLSVTISGSARDGQTLTATAVANDVDAVVTYQWQSHIGSTWTNISGATASTYVVTEANEGTQLRVIATSTDSDGSGTTTTSAATGQVTDPPVTLTVTVSGTAQEGQTLTATAVPSFSDSDSTITYQWQSLSGSTWSNITGATAPTYKVAETNEGHQLRVVATYRDSDGTGATANSVATAAVTDVPAPLTISNNSITVAAGGSIPLPITVGTSDSDDTVTVTIAGLTSYETVTDTLDHKVFSGSSITLTAAEVNSGLTLASSYTGTDHPVNILNVTSNITTSGEAVTSPVQTITVTDPPAATTTSIPDQPNLAAGGNIIAGTTPDATLTNVDNIISGFVHEQLAAPDHGGIGAQVSTFAQAQHSPNRNGDPQGTGQLGDGNVSGTGSALIDGEASLELGGRFSGNITLDPGAHATVKIDHAVDFSGTVAGLNGNDVLDLADLAFGSNTTLGYAANSNNTGGTMTVTDGTHTANIALLGQYMAASFSTSADGFGGTLIHDVPSAALMQTLTQPQHA
jgi:regulation of enolase protein 1 (concanavalin A-like superfamily)